CSTGCGEAVCPPPRCYKNCRFAILPCTDRLRLLPVRRRRFETAITSTRLDATDYLLPCPCSFTQASRRASIASNRQRDGLLFESDWLVAKNRRTSSHTNLSRNEWLSTLPIQARTIEPATKPPTHHIYLRYWRKQALIIQQIVWLRASLSCTRLLPIQQTVARPVITGYIRI
ncbi:hypothetical protein PpBr36_03701, partial [Pyricularia pennisetigena]|uniref:hypothetical protein n=1 Tax=Pyricularia pennisetigena TaxID=1578925 RepID=UPI0011507743